ncbi:hypothetical protein LTR17_015749 [Elasticomyces elasticus]|nr:hypothetical protein LTR17_015749 [Elasticomyces elasticus]
MASRNVLSKVLLTSALSLSCFVRAEVRTGNSTSGASITFPVPTGTSTSYQFTSFNKSYGTHVPQPGYSDEQLAFLWNQVGPVSTGIVTTTVSPTAEASVLPNPGGSMHPYVPSYEANLSNYQLPEFFRWGVASSSYQIEGAADAEGKGPNVVAQHYYLYKQDFARIKALGIQSFSPSISWPRIFPFGNGPVNEAGVQHYDDVIAELIDNGIRPVVTLFHWDMPLALFNEYGAWNDRRIVDDFFEYATFVIQRYDEYVDTWFTINEPQYCNWQFSQYPAGEYYPQYDNVQRGIQSRFLCGHYTLLAHAKVAKWYHEEFKGRGRITFKNSGNYIQANDSSSNQDKLATQRQNDFSLGWFNHGPWFDGDYPQTLKDTLGSLLPNLTQDEKDMIKGSCDFFAIDGYTAFYAFGTDDFEACISDPSHGGFPECSGVTSEDPDGFPIGPSSASGFYSTPVGIRRYLSVITKELFPSVPDIMVSEFGYAEPQEGQLSSLDPILWDLRRADYFQSYLDNILAAIAYDGVNVTGIFGWAIFDNFEWGSGTSVRFGLQYVNYTDLTRTPKASMFTFLRWFSDHGALVSANQTVDTSYRVKV